MPSNEEKYTGYQYKLRTSAPMSVGDPGGGTFVVHTFMAEKNLVEVYTYTTNLPNSEEFRGQQGEYISAQFSRLPDRSGDVFSGKIVYTPEYIDETQLEDEQ